MHMSFWWSSKLNNFLFGGFNITSVSGMVATCFAVASLAFLFECARYIQALQRQKELYLRSEQLKTICPSESSTLLTENANPANPLNISLLDRSLLVGADISLWFFLQNLGYILMLAVMLYNGWLFISAAIGGGLGYFTFGQLFMKINLQNCQIMRDTFCKLKCGESEGLPSSRNGESTPALETPNTSQASLSCHNIIVHAECER